jgi:AmmeMemoRadiSam system protein B
MEITRKPAVAGAFYPGEKDSLKYMIDEFFKICKPCDCKKQAKAMIVPHAGYMYSGIVAAEGYKCLKKLDQKKHWKILLLGPSHFIPFTGAAIPESDFWETPLGKVEIGKLPTSEIIIEDEKPHEEEHSLEVQVPFLQTVLEDFTLYPLCLGEVNPKDLAKELKDFADQDDVIIIVSSDLSHFYEYDEAKKLDDKANKYIPALDIKNAEKVEACGIKGVLTFMHIAKMINLEGCFIDYKNSGDTAGDKDRVVGYGCYVFMKK